MIARSARNFIHNYTDAQRKVRSATSNDAWGPPPALMHEIAALTNNMVAYSEMMPIIWKRLNDHGKNWRHVYKSLVLLDHLIKYGNERVAQQCKEHIFAIQTLKDFQYIEDQKDQGHNVRERAKQLVALLKDDDVLRNERRKAQEGREHFVRQTGGLESNGPSMYGRPTTGSSGRRSSIEGDSYSYGQGASSYSSNHRSTSYNDNLRAAPSREFGAPASQEEEQMQIQIALAESQREAEDEERRRRNDDLKLRIALERSVTDGTGDSTRAQPNDYSSGTSGLDPSIFGQPAGGSMYPTIPPSSSGNLWYPSGNQSSNNFGSSIASNDPWGQSTNMRTSAPTASNDPWHNSSSASSWQPVVATPTSWSGTTSTTNDNNNGLSINLSDPWGVGATTTRTVPKTPTSTPLPSTIDSELSDIFGANTAISTPSNNYHQISSNPWEAPSSTTGGYPTPPMGNPVFSTGQILTPTAASSYTLTPTSASPLPTALSASRKTPESFLGDTFSALVNLEKLVPDNKPSTNPFGTTPARTGNPFASATKAPTLEQLSSSNSTNFSSGSTLPAPLIPSTYQGNNTTIPTTFDTTNPFL